MYGKGCDGIDGQWREDWIDPVFEDLREVLSLSFLEVVPVGDLEAAGRQSRADVSLEDLRLAFHQGHDTVANGIELLSRGHSVGRAAADAGDQLPAEAGDTNLEELVEIATEDREEPGALEDGTAFVLGHREDALVEVEPRELAIEKAGLGPGTRRGRREFDVRRALGLLLGLHAGLRLHSSDHPVSVVGA